MAGLGGGAGHGVGGRVSPLEMNLDSPPSSKKQRSTSDTTVYHTPYGFSHHHHHQQHSPGHGIHSPGAQSHSPHSPSASPQPPPSSSASSASSSAVSFEGLSALQTHLIKVQQSYGINRMALEQRQKRRHRSPREKPGRSQGHSPRRKHSGGVKSGSVSPSSVQSNEGEEPVERPSPWVRMLEERGSGSSGQEGGEREGEEKVLMNNNQIKSENSEHSKSV